jgi:carboxyl-terminal processing protease
MDFMMKDSTRRLTIALAMFLATAATPVLAQPQNPASELATVEDLKTQAFAALREGRFDESSRFIDQAREINNDPTLKKMSGWLGEFQTKQARYDDKRRTEYDKLIGETRRLDEAGFHVDVSDWLARSMRYADDRDTFRKDEWNSSLIHRTIDMAARAEADGKWIRAGRLYANLSIIEPNNNAWRLKVNEMYRRRALLLMYTPDYYGDLLLAEAKDSDQARQLVNPDAAPTTRPADEALDDEFKIDWREMLAGVKPEMLREALELAHERYQRDATYAEMIHGGVKQMSLLSQTSGLEKTFPSLGDQAKVKAFIDAVADIEARLDLEEKNRVVNHRTVGRVINDILAANMASIDLPESVIVYEFANGATGVLDQFTTVIWPYDLPEFTAQTSGEFSGVGIQIQNSDDGYIRVVTPLEDSPALRAGVQPDEVITHINGKSAKGLTTDRATKHIKGPIGTIVTLTMRRPDGVSRDLVLRRDIIKTASIKGWNHRVGGGWDYLIDADNGVGYIRLTNFTKETSRELGAALKQVQRDGGRAVVLDLRTNPGGLLNAAAEVVDKFIDKGVIVSTRSSRANAANPAPLVAHAQAEDIKSLPLIVLVNQFSASASEIVSGALKDHERALVIGERTFGKGSVQIIAPLPGNDSALKLTTSHYYLPSGRCIHREDDSVEWGVEPHMVVEITPEQIVDMNRLRQELDILRDAPATQPTTVPAEYSSVGEYLLASDPQLSTALLLLRMQLAGAPVM